MEKKFFILIGKSGSGKGTQAELLSKYLKDNGLENVLHVTTGGGFRDFIKRDNYVARTSKDLNDKGELQPGFLAVWNMANIFIENLKDNDTVILDGAPRRAFEIEILDEATRFMNYKERIVIYIDVSSSWAKEKLLERKREDDNEQEIDKRLEWFDKEVLEVISIYKDDPRYKYIHINGEKKIEEVHNDIIANLSKLM